MFAKGSTTIESRGGPDFAPAASFGGAGSIAFDGTGVATGQSDDSSAGLMTGRPMTRQGTPS